MKLNYAISELTRLKDEHEYTSRLHNSIGDKEQAIHYFNIATECSNALRVLKIVQTTLCGECPCKAD